MNLEKNSLKLSEKEKRKRQWNTGYLLVLTWAIGLAAAGGIMLQKIQKGTRQKTTIKLEEIDRKAAPYFNQAREAVPRVVKKMKRPKKVLLLCWKLACDKTMGGNRAEKYLAKQIQPVVLHCEKAASFYGIRLNSPEFAKCMKNISKEYLKASAFPIGSLGLEAIMIRTTLNSVSRICGSVVARMAGCSAAGSAAALADGPLPIGDIIGVTLAAGGTIWSLYDLKKISKRLSRDLREALLNTVDNCQFACRKVYLQ